MKFKIEIELEKVSGADQDQETMLDLLAYTIGKENGARRPVKLEVYDDNGMLASTYIVKSVDDA